MNLENKLEESFKKSFKSARYNPGSKLINYVSFALFGLTSLFGCGGGSGPDDPVPPIQTPPVQPPQNRSPVISSILKSSSREGDNYFDRVIASDHDNDILTYSLTTSPNGMTINSNDGSISWPDAKEGSFPVEVQVSDNKGGIAAQGNNLNVSNAFDDISGKITDILNGNNISGVDIQLGHKDNGVFVADYSARTDVNGNYAFTKIPTGIDRLVELKNNPNYYNRFAGVFTSNSDITNLNLDQIPTRFNLAFFDEVARAPGDGSQTQRWLQQPQVYINTSPALGSNVQPTQQEIDLVESIFRNDVPRFNHDFTTSNITITKGSTPPASNTPSYIIFSWDDSQGSGVLGAHGERLNGNEIINAICYVKTGLNGSEQLAVYRQEITQPFGARNDSNLESSIFNDPQFVDRYQQIDLDTGLILYSRQPGNKNTNSTPDANLDTYRIRYNSTTGKWE